MENMLVREYGKVNEGTGEDLAEGWFYKVMSRVGEDFLSPEQCMLFRHSTLQPVIDFLLLICEGRHGAVDLADDDEVLRTKVVFSKGHDCGNTRGNL